MTARRIREWPRVIAAAVVIAAVLIVIGVVVASASTGGGSGGGSSSATAALRQRDARQATALRHDAQTLTSLRSQLAASTAQLSAERSQLTRSRARAYCWRQLALHPHAKPVANCATAS